MTTQPVQQQQPAVQPVAVQHRLPWELMAVLSMFASFALALGVDFQWGVYIMLFAIFCAAMK